MMYRICSGKAEIAIYEIVSYDKFPCLIVGKQNNKDNGKDII